MEGLLVWLIGLSVYLAFNLTWDLVVVVLEHLTHREM